MPAFAHAIAMPPPIVPAPTIADASRLSPTEVSFETPGTRDTPRSAKKA